jgi:hypothetical protein
MPGRERLNPGPEAAPPAVVSPRVEGALVSLLAMVPHAIDRRAGALRKREWRVAEEAG